MRKQSVLLMVVLVIGLLLAACAPSAEPQDAMMDETTSPEMMEEATEAMPDAEPDQMMEASPTEEMMMDETPDAMMEKTATPEMMEDEAADGMEDDMMESTGTPEMMEEKPADPMMDETPVPMTGEETPEAEMMDDQSGMMAPAWFATPLTDALTGETFMLEDFKGKVVLVETFAQWCPTCLRQQREVAKLHEMLGMPDDLVSVALDVDPNEDAAMLQTYLETHGFDGHYAIAPAEMVREIGDLYGTQFLNPPSAPMLIVDRHGEVHELPFGVKSAEDLQKALEPFLSGGM